ncbi:MAG: site-2 protease family protein [Candidatus Thermoplasmatota archaeon]|nr:site-2 protease family protein [Candidatus Thermoplasmatota archaeon]
MSALLIVPLAIAIYLLVILILQRKKLLGKHNLSLSGPILMWRTERGKNFIDQISKHKFWKHFGSFALVLSTVVGIAMFFVLIWSANLARKMPAERAPTPQMLIGLPGINPLIPVGYGIVALIIAIVLHEFSHGILARVAKVNLKSLGLLFLVVPLGAFIEPDDEELKRVAKLKRCSVFAAGPATNILVALVCACIFSWIFMSAVAPVADGIFVTGVFRETPAENEIPLGAIVTKLNDSDTKSFDDFFPNIAKTKANQTVNITFYYRGNFINKNITLGDRGDGCGYLGIECSDPKAVQTLLSRPFYKAESVNEFIGRSFYYVSLPFLALEGRSPLSQPWTDIYTVQGPLGFLPPWLFWLLANLFYWVFWLNLALGMTNALFAVPLDGGYMFRDFADFLIIKRRYAVPIIIALLCALFLLILLSALPSLFSLALLIIWLAAICTISITIATELRLGFGIAELAPEERDNLVKPISYALSLTILFLILWLIIRPRV